MEKRGSRWWVWMPLWSLGLLSWASILYAGVRAQVRAWQLWAIPYFVGAIAAGVLVSVGGHHRHDSVSTAGGLLIILLCGGGLAHAMAIRQRFDELTVGTPQLAQAERRLAIAQQAREIAKQDPRRAKALGIGRPDVPRSFDGGLVDINNASAEAISRLPGIDVPLACKIVEVRDQLGGFSSLEDMDLVIDLPADRMDSIREQAVFLPR